METLSTSQHRKLWGGAALCLLLAFMCSACSSGGNQTPSRASTSSSCTAVAISPLVRERLWEGTFTQHAAWHLLTYDRCRIGWLPVRSPKIGEEWLAR